MEVQRYAQTEAEGSQSSGKRVLDELLKHGDIKTRGDVERPFADLK